MKKILVIGSLNMDFSIKTDKIPQIGETVKGLSFLTNPGGKGANQAFALGKLGSDVKMIGLVGNDSYGEELIDNLKGANVDTTSIGKLNEVRTGVAFVTVNKDGDNNIIVISGANEKVDKATIDKNIGVIKESDIIVMQLEIPIDVVLYIARIAKENNKMVILDPAPARSDLPLELFKYIDIIKPNETELQTLTGKTINTKEDIPVLGTELLNRGVKNVIVTLGDEGSFLINNKTQKKYSALKVNVVDTTAAGDSFTAALVNYLSKDKSLEESIEFAHLVSSIVVTKPGAQSSIPTIEEVKKYERGENAI